ncbi:MAG: alpha-mannosidase [Candidatus Hydrogenedentes bacterium]|nr:alpha-mannosidase [Candidatus Hydrogenedentota bacterium]
MADFDAERKIEVAQIQRRIREIQGTIITERQPIGDFQYCVTGTGKGPERAPQSGWKPFKVRGVWGGLDQTTWFRFKVRIPHTMKGKQVAALIRTYTGKFTHGAPDLNEGGEALVFVNGQPVQGLDRNRDEIFLAKKVKGGETFDIVLEACPSTRYDMHHTFGYADLAVINQAAWEFYWDAQVVWEVLHELDWNFAPTRKLIELLDTAVRSVDLQHKGEKPYWDSLLKAQKALRRGLKAFESGPGMGKLILAGHAHIDTAWLWPLRETKRKCARTFSNILSLMDRYPELHFSCSQPVQYEWIKTYYPELYKRIKQRVKEGRWELCGAPWVEPDHNVPSGESLIRQYLYGNRFYEREFGKRSHIAWVPDSFGYTWALPQIMKKAGLTAFVTTKVEWSVFTQFPYSMFEWEGTDGTRIFALMPPLNYNGNPVPKDCIAQWNQFKQKERVEELPFPFGWGDGGGGPTMNMIEHGRRLENIMGVPKCEFGRLSDCVERMRRKSERETLPVYNNELYLELHRGCQTTQARTKRNNRKCEILLRDAEFLSVLAHLDGGKYDHGRLWESWKTILTNQFHDILPGSSVTEVYTQADVDYAEAMGLARDVRDSAIKHILKTIDTRGEGTPVVVFNTLGWVRSDVAEVALDGLGAHVTVLDPGGNPVPHQRIGKDRLLFEAHNVPPLGHAVYRVVVNHRRAEAPGMLKATSTGMENDYILIRFDKAGNLTRVYDKVEEREVLPKGARANVFQLFDDRPWEHDAWDIDHNFERQAWEAGPAESIKVIETGPVRAVVRMVRRTEKSTFTQDIVLHASSPRIDFITHVDWREKRVLLKVAFPVDIRATRATYEIQYGTIERATHQNTAFNRARFENAALRWADLSEGDYGVSLLNDCKYAYDVRDNVLRLSLLRSPVDPDPHADEGPHEFTYSLLPHAWGWRNGMVHEGHELNTPLLAVPAAKSKGAHAPVAAFASVDLDNVIIDHIKKHEDSDAVIVRLYEAHGQRGDATLTFGRKPTSITECDLMEEDDTPVKLQGNTVKFYVRPYELRTFKVQFA